MTRSSFPDVGNVEPDAEILELLAFTVGGGTGCEGFGRSSPVLIDPIAQVEIEQVEVGSEFEVCSVDAFEGFEYFDPNGDPLRSLATWGPALLPGSPPGTYSAIPLGGGDAFEFEVVPTTRPRMLVPAPEANDAGILEVDVFLGGYEASATLQVAVYDGGGVSYIEEGGVPAEPAGELLGVLEVATDEDGDAHVVLSPSDPNEASCALLIATPDVLAEGDAVGVSDDGSTYVMGGLDGYAASVCFESLRAQIGA